MRSPSIVPEPTTAQVAEKSHPGVDPKTPAVDYFAMLSRAVARLDRDSYEARGAIYDRAQAVLDKRLASATSPFSKEEATKQRLALRDAIRRIEFEDRENHDVISLEQTGEQETTAGADLDAASEIKPERRGVFGRVAVRLLFAALILGIGIGAYAYDTGKIEFPNLTNLIGRVIGSPSVQRASLYERGTTDAKARALNGTANWRIFSEGTGTNAQPVLQVDIQFPERGLSLVLSMRRETDDAAAMSHLIELRFLRPDHSPFAEITRVGGIAMTTAERSGSAVVMGQTTKVTLGVFLFGLYGGKTQREENLRILRELTWIEIPISYQDGSQALIAIEKGAAGERLINQFFGDPGQS
jgi:hypothetical protein